MCKRVIEFPPPVMEKSAYDAIVTYLRNNILPDVFPSTQSNFRATCAKFELRNDTLFRSNKKVLKENELEQVWHEFHGNFYFSHTTSGIFHAQIRHLHSKFFSPVYA